MSRSRIRARAGLERADVELGVQVGLGEAVGREVEVGDVRLLRAASAGRGRRGTCPSVRNLPISCSTSTCLCIVVASTIAPATLRLLPSSDERLDDRRVRDVGRAAAQRVEVRAPVGATAAGIGEVALVQLLDERRVAAEQRARRLEFLHACSWMPSSSVWRVAPRRRPAAPAAGAPLLSACAIGLTVAARRAGEELPRAADLVLRVGDHLVQLRDPADGAREREDRR